MIHPQEIHHFLSSIISKPPKIAIIIDKVTDEVREASEALKKLGETEVVEFKTFVRKDAPNVHAHLFEPLYMTDGKEPYRNWHSRLAWVDDNVRDLVNELRLRIVKLGDVDREIHGVNLCFYRGKPSTKTIFVAFMLRKKALKVRIRTDPNKFTDTKKWTGNRVYKGWFFKKGQEREFKITKKEQIEYAMELISQAYKHTLLIVEDSAKGKNKTREQKTNELIDTLMNR